MIATLIWESYRRNILARAAFSLSATSKTALGEIMWISIADCRFGYFRTTLVRDDALLANVTSVLDGWLDRARPRPARIPHVWSIGQKVSSRVGGITCLDYRSPFTRNRGYTEYFETEKSRVREFTSFLYFRLIVYDVSSKLFYDSASRTRGRRQTRIKDMTLSMFYARFYAVFVIWQNRREIRKKIMKESRGQVNPDSFGKHCEKVWKFLVLIFYIYL